MATELGGRGGKGGMVHGLRSLGRLAPSPVSVCEIKADNLRRSSTLDMVYVASGQGDIMFEGQFTFAL